jgi:hypothetical protein
MKLIDYFELVNQKIKDGHYRVEKFKDVDVEVNSPYLESINYIIWEFLKSKNDTRIELIFDYIIVPNIDWTFNFDHMTFEQFLNFLIEVKR